MRYGFVIPTGDPRTVAELAHELEAHGWDGAFYWDGMALGGDWDEVGGEIYDPWVVMAAMAMRTERVRIGAIVTPPSRRRPWKLARETMTLDRLSNGRLVVPVGLGAVDSFGRVGEETDRKTRAALLDESLAILAGLWRGEPFSFHGDHYQIGEMTFRPTPVQRPGPPIWVVGAWPRPRSMARALRYDGVLPYPLAADGTPGDLTPEVVAAIAAYAAEQRGGAPFEIVAEGTTPADDAAAAAAKVGRLAEAGATWWIESPWEAPNRPDDLRRRIVAGPPRGG